MGLRRELTMRQRTLLPLAALSLIMPSIAGCDTQTNGGAVATSVTQAGTSIATGQSNGEAAGYCTSKGGQVVRRHPVYGYGGSNPLQLAGSLQFCQFTAQDKSMIAISLDTLYTEQPTLATLAYLEKPPMGKPPNPGANPGSFYCTQLGGSDLFGGVNTTGGGWVSDDKNDPFNPLETCIFPDLSTIDSVGAYLPHRRHYSGHRP